jgi:hypothetical protein
MAIETDNKSFQTNPNQMVEDAQKFFASMIGPAGK